MWRTERTNANERVWDWANEEKAQKELNFMCWIVEICKISVFTSTSVSKYDKIVYIDIYNRKNVSRTEWILDRLRWKISSVQITFGEDTEKCLWA